MKVIECSDNIIDKLCSFLDSDKKIRVERMVNKRNKIQSIIGELIVKSIIVDKLNVNRKSILFSKNKYGKPYLIEYPDFNFNISHSGDYVLCAIDDKPIGVDVEEVKPIECEEISKNFFTAREFDYIVNQDSKFQLDRFYEIWTLKESYIKCCGQGLSMPLKSFSIEVDQFKNIKVFSNNEYKEHMFKLFNIDLGYKVAVCSLNKEISNNIIRLDQNCLISKYIGFNLE